MKVVESYLRKSHGVRDPLTKRTIKTVIWPPTDKEKIIPIALKFAKGILKTFQFWAYDPKMAETVTVTQEQSIRLADTLDLMSFHEEDIMILGQSHIRTNDQYEVCAKSWTCAVGNAIKNHLFADATPLYGGPPN
ncbi:hypothetical protein Hanom_Chr14g01277271 [Helianthus anomalus]